MRCLRSEEMLFQVGALWMLFCVEVNTVGSWNWEEGSGGMRGRGDGGGIMEIHAFGAGDHEVA